MEQMLIIQLLKEREANLLNELSQVRSVLNNFLTETANTDFKNPNAVADIIYNRLSVYGECRTYNEKVLFILESEGKPLMVDEIVSAIKTFEPGIDSAKVHHTISYTLSMLVKYRQIKKHPFNRKVKYSVPN